MLCNVSEREIDLKILLGADENPRFFATQIQIVCFDGQNETSSPRFSKAGHGLAIGSQCIAPNYAAS
jgi:hypothetical protein